MRKFALIIGIILISLQITLAQEDDAPPEGVEFRPVEAILDGQKLEPTNFASDGTATLPIETTLPVACSIVYGTTPEFGQLAVDMDMAGGAHTEHSPLLTGLEPETTYYFRVQGVDNNGVIYISEVMTFTTPVFDTNETENLASSSRGAEIIGFSSAFGNAELDERWGAGSAFDDNPNTQWSSAGDGDEAWVEVKLARPAKIEAVEFWSRSMSDGTAITLAFTITTETGQVYGPFEVPDANEPYEFEISFEADTLRFDLVETTGGNTGITDIAIYGEFIEE